MVANVHSLGSEFIEVHVGAAGKTKTFTAHKDVLIGSSKFFANALNGSWKEAKDNCVNLPEDDADLFGHYIKLIYFRHIDIPEELNPADGDLESQSNRLSCREYNFLAKLYILCEKLQDLRAINLVMDAFVENTNRKQANDKFYYPSDRVVSFVYENTPEKCPLRSYLVDCHVFAGRKDWLVDTDTLPKEFLADVVRGMLKNRKIPTDCKHQTSSNYYQKANNDK